MQELLTAITALNQYGWAAITTFVVAGFLTGMVLTRGHHKEVVEAFKTRIGELQDQIKELRSENQQLRQALAITQTQATRATAISAGVIERAV